MCLCEDDLNYYIVYSMAVWMLDLQLLPEAPDQISSHSSYHQNLQIRQQTISNLAAVDRSPSFKSSCVDCKILTVVALHSANDWHVGMWLTFNLGACCHDIWEQVKDHDWFHGKQVKISGLYWIWTTWWHQSWNHIFLINVH